MSTERLYWMSALSVSKVSKIQADTTLARARALGTTMFTSNVSYCMLVCKVGRCNHTAETSEGK
jgi:hypothetical protein